jgi:hypothetical protein
VRSGEQKKAMRKERMLKTLILKITAVSMVSNIKTYMNLNVNKNN